MGHVVVTSQWISERVHCGNRRIGKSLACQRGAQQHGLSRRDVVGVRQHASLISTQQGQRLPCEHVRHRVLFNLRGIRLNGVHHGIDTGHGRHVSRQAQCQFGIEHRDIG